MTLLRLHKPPSTPDRGTSLLALLLLPSTQTQNLTRLPPSQGCNARQFYGKFSGPCLAELRGTDDICLPLASAPTSSTAPAGFQSPLADARATETNWSPSEVHTASAHTVLLRVWGPGMPPSHQALPPPCPHLNQPGSGGGR